MEYIWKRNNILPTRTSFFISSAGKIESMQEFRKGVFSKHDILYF